MVGKRILPWFGGHSRRLGPVSFLLPDGSIRGLRLRPSPDPIRSAKPPTLGSRGLRRARDPGSSHPPGCELGHRGP